MAQVGISSGDLLADVLVPSEAVLPVVDPARLLAESVDEAGGAVGQEARDVTAALARVLELAVVLVSRLVAVVRDQVGGAGGNTGGDEHQELA